MALSSDRVILLVLIVVSGIGVFAVFLPAWVEGDRASGFTAMAPALLAVLAASTALCALGYWRLRKRLSPGRRAMAFAGLAVAFAAQDLRPGDGSQSRTR